LKNQEHLRATCRRLITHFYGDFNEINDMAMRPCCRRIFFLVSLWGLMWIFSSFSLAGGYCGNNFSIFNEDFKCRQPFIAALVFFVCGILSLVSFFISKKYRKKKIPRNKYVSRKTDRKCRNTPYTNRAASSRPWCA
jgi:hypothetical protein